MSFADQLKKAREKAGLSIADAAKERGVAPSRGGTDRRWTAH